MKIDHSASFAEQYSLDPLKYGDTSVLSLPLSVRVKNRLRTNRISTLAELLQKSPDDLMQFRGFGYGCIENICELLESMTEGYIPPKDVLPRGANIGKEQKKFAQKYRQEILQGDFSFLTEGLLDKGDEEAADEIKRSFLLLGPEMVNECAVNPSRVKILIRALDEFSIGTERVTKIKSLVQELPAQRRQNLAKGYIFAYTSDENLRKLLLSLYESETASLENIKWGALSEYDCLLCAEKFLKWCSFNLVEDVNALIESIAEKDRMWSVIEMRAQGQTLEKCGEQWNVTRERVRQIEKKAFNIFRARQGKINLIPKISAEKNGDAVVTLSDVKHYGGGYSTGLLYLLQNSKSKKYIYDDQLGAFIVGDGSLRDQVYAFVESLPNMFSAQENSEYLRRAEERELPVELVERAISEIYKLDGQVYHKERLNRGAIYKTILANYYPNGFKVYDAYEYNRFRALVKKHYGDIKMADNARALSARIADIGILCDRGTYKAKQEEYIPQSLAERIYAYIKNSDENLFLMNTLFSLFEEDLRKAGVDNKYYLQGILRELYGNELAFSRDYVSKDGEVTSIYPRVVEFIRQFHYPVSKEQIQEKFPGIPDIVLAFSVSNPKVLNYFGEYLYADELKIDPEEVNYLEQVISRLCKDGSAHHIKDIYEIVEAEKPEIFRRNAAVLPFSAYSIMEYLFRDQYQFSRPYIAAPGVKIGTAIERFHEWIYGMEEFTFEEMVNGARENNFQIQSHLDFINACNDKYLIANKAEVKSIDKIGVTEEIAIAVEKAVLSEVKETMPICQLTCWSKFPPIHIPWTDWLVYSVLYKWSTQLSVAPSSNQFRMSIPLVAPKGMIDPALFADAYKNASQTKEMRYDAPDDLDNIDDLLVELIGDDVLEDETWD